MKLVVLEFPFSGDVEKNLICSRKCGAESKR